MHVTSTIEMCRIQTTQKAIPIWDISFGIKTMNIKDEIHVRKYPRLNMTPTQDKHEQKQLNELNSANQNL